MQLPGRSGGKPYDPQLAREAAAAALIPFEQRTAAQLAAASWDPLEAATLVKLFNEHFGQGTVSLDFVSNEMSADAYMAWWAYFGEYAKVTELRKDQAEHDDVMGKVRKALKP